MSLGKCRKCGKIASSEAKVCPHCQVRRPVKQRIVRHPAPQARTRRIPHFSHLLRMSRRRKGIIIGASLVLVVAAAYLFDLSQESRPLAPTRITRVAAAPLSQEGSHRFAMTAAIARTVKNSVPDPDGLVWDRMLANDNGTVVCLSYHLKVDEDQYAPGYLSYVNGKASETLQDWNIHCAGTQLNDMQLVQEAMRE